MSNSLFVTKFILECLSKALLYPCLGVQSLEVVGGEGWNSHSGGGCALHHLCVPLPSELRPSQRLVLVLLRSEALNGLRFLYALPPTEPLFLLLFKRTKVWKSNNSARQAVRTLSKITSF